MAARHTIHRACMASTMLAALVMAGTAVEASAQGSINLAWDDCSIGPALDRKTFACNSNVGTLFTLFASFAPPAGVTEYVGLSSTLYVDFATGAPDWWKFGVGQCRSTSGLAVSFDFTAGPFNCIDPHGGAAAGGLSYEIGYGTPDRSRLRVAGAMPSANRTALDEGVEHYAFKVNVTRSKTTGAGSCAGCTVPASITLDHIQLFQPAELGFDPVLTTPLVSTVAHWQDPPVGIMVDATALEDSFSVSGGTCRAPGQVYALQVPAGANTILSCSNNVCGVGAPSVPFSVSAGGIVSYDPILEGPLEGAGTNTLVINSFIFPPPGDSQESSMGLFRIVVNKWYWDLMDGYPGYAVVNGLHRLISPRLYDPQTKIGRSSSHRHGSAADVGGTPVGTAGTIVSDADFTVLPLGFQGPAGTLEMHTELRTLNMIGSGGFAVRAGTQAPARPISPGEIEAGPDAAGLFPAESFFNVNVEVDLPVFGTLYNTRPLVVENSGIHCFPPRVVYLHKHTGPVPVAFKNTDTEDPPRWQAGQVFGWLVLAGHGFDFDNSGVAASGIRTLGDPFAELEAIVNAEPEMSDTATSVIDLEDVITSAPPAAYVQPQYRDQLLDGIEDASALGHSGDPCAGTHLLIDLYQRVDGRDQPDDWVSDPAIRDLLKDRIQVLGAHLQAQANQGGGCEPTGVEDLEPAPARVAILGIQPNPTAGAATIRYAVPKAARVTMSVYDLAGRLVQKLVDADLEAGTHRATWDGSRYRVRGPRASSGTYFVRLNVGGVVEVKRLVILE